MSHSHATSVYAQHGLFVRVIYLLVAIAWWLGTLVFRGLRGGCRGAVVLCYHGVSDAQRRRFAWQMTRLADRAIDAAGLNADLRSNTIQPPICVTFDDAFANLLGNALPVMQQLEVPALIFAVPGNLAATPRWPMPRHHPEAAETTMSAPQIHEARSTLCCFGSHTFSHPNLADLPAERLQEELCRSRHMLQQILDHDVEDLALPFGAYNPQVITAARAAGYKRIFTLEPCLRPVTPHVIGRFSMTPDVWGLEFQLTCAGAYAWLRPWRRFLRMLRRARSIHTRKEPALV